MILCAIGGDDTYRLAPYLFANGELETAVSGTDKIFLGFSDTTVNHMMLHKVGVKTFYGQSFLSDVCELGGEMLPYTRRYFEELIRTGTIRAVTPSDTWYEARTDFSPEQAGVPLPAHPDTGFELLQEDPASPVRSRRVHRYALRLLRRRAVCRYAGAVSKVRSLPKRGGLEGEDPSARIE